MDSNHHANYPRTAIRQVHLERFDQDLDNLNGYDKVLVFFRARGSLLGEFLYDVNDGKIAYEDLRTGLGSLAWPIWQQLAVNTPDEKVDYSAASIVVCTRDRPDDLKNCLDSLLPFTANGVEIIAVDNSPSDERSASLLKEYPSIRYVLEPKPGLNVARNTGIQCANGKIIAFTDDDAVVDTNWLGKILRNFADPTVAVATGIALPIELNTKAQQWFETTNSFKRGFVRRKFDVSNINPIAAGIVGAGVNMAVRRSCLKRIGNFDEVLDCGTPTRSGGDQEFFYRVLSSGYRIAYDPDAIVWHRHRDSWEELKLTLFGYGVGLSAWWTRAFFIEREISLLRWGLPWLLKHHIGNLIRSLLKTKNGQPFDISFEEFKGAISGPFYYFYSRYKSKTLQN